MLEDDKVAAKSPVQDLQRARSFYEEKLGLEPSEQRPGGLLYCCGSGELALFESAGAAISDRPQLIPAQTRRTSRKAAFGKRRGGVTSARAVD